MDDDPNRNIGELRGEYLDLLKRILTRTGFESSFSLLNPLAYPKRGRARAAWHLQNLLNRYGYALVRNAAPDLRANGRDWPSDAETMIGMKRLDNLQACVESVLRDRVEGDLIETGVWRGGACILMRGVLKAYGVNDRVVWAADSFKGLPEPDASTYPADQGDAHWSFSQLAVPLETVKANFARYGLLDDQVRFLVGWFRDTLPSASIDKLSVLRLDGDMYASTYEALESLYPKLSVGGWAIVDDYHLPGCRQAVADYRTRVDILEPIEEIDGMGVFWRREHQAT